MPKGVPWPQDVFDRALELSARGLSSYAVARTLGIPRASVANWLSRPGIPRPRMQLGRCSACGGAAHDQPPAGPYAYLLGLYLGDGCLAIAGRRVYLSIAFDALYPGIISECRRAIGAVLPYRSSYVNRDPRKRCEVVRSYGREWRCLFPQHGPGRKHNRDIMLTSWQCVLVDAEPGLFLRGLIHSDGWRGLNRVRVGGRDYAYPRYQFSNRSDDIRRLFTDACDRLDIAWRPWGRWNISVARRDAVARLDTFVGPKY